MRECLKSKTFRFLLLVLIWFFATAAAVFVQAQPRADSRQQDKQSQATEPASSDYVGAETCKQCHSEIYESWAKTPHWRTTLDTKGGPSHQGCEGCHGPGRAHVEGGGDKTKIYVFTEHSPTEINTRCLTCHASGPTHLHSPNSFHRQNEVSCIDCHSPHHATTKEALLIKAEPGLCYSCHLQQKSQFNMPFRHRVNEGLIKCTDCHNQHGSEGVWESDHLVRQLRTSDSGSFPCFKCHKDKQGPFVFEHASVKVEGCAACHIPHGGANVHMLRYSNIDLQCLQCHTAAHFGRSQAGTAPATGFPVMTAQESTQQQGCTLCHTQIHGSNFSTLFFR